MDMCPKPGVLHRAGKGKGGIREEVDAAFWQDQVREEKRPDH